MLISEEVAFDILKTYRRLGPDWLFKIAQDRPDLFINQCLSKILPPAFKESDSDVVNNTQINFNSPNEMFENARAIAFVLAAGVAAQQEIAPVAERRREDLL